jgi:hypothetical protein
MMPRPGDRPLSDFWTEHQRRLYVREVDLIIARHRVVFEQARLADEAERRNPIKVVFS